MRGANDEEKFSISDFLRAEGLELENFDFDRYVSGDADRTIAEAANDFVIDPESVNS